MSRVGIFGGTFDPIHTGHLILLEEARYELRLDSIVVVPAADPPHKQGNDISSVSHRMCMCELATLDVDCVHISRIDADRPGPHYSVDMVRLLQDEHGADAVLYFLVGMDSLRDLPTWREPQLLLDLCTLVAFSRAQVEIDWRTLDKALPGIRDRVEVIEMPELEISSTDLRARVRTRRPIRFQTPRLVEEYIRSQGLYRT